MIEDIVNFLGQDFEMNVADVHCIIGLEIERDRTAKALKVHQGAYTKRILERFDMVDCKAVATPADVGVKLSVLTKDEKTTDMPYAEAVGSLMYLMTGSRPDIAFAVGKVRPLHV